MRNFRFKEIVFRSVWHCTMFIRKSRILLKGGQLRTIKPHQDICLMCLKYVIYSLRTGEGGGGRGYTAQLKQWFWFQKDIFCQIIMLFIYPLPTESFCGETAWDMQNEENWIIFTLLAVIFLKQNCTRNKRHNKCWWFSLSKWLTLKWQQSFHFHSNSTSQNVQRVGEYGLHLKIRRFNVYVNPTNINRLCHAVQSCFSFVSV